VAASWTSGVLIHDGGHLTPDDWDDGFRTQTGQNINVAANGIAKLLRMMTEEDDEITHGPAPNEQTRLEAGVGDQAMREVWAIITELSGHPERQATRHRLPFEK